MHCFDKCSTAVQRSKDLELWSCAPARTRQTTYYFVHSNSCSLCDLCLVQVFVRVWSIRKVTYLLKHLLHLLIYLYSYNYFTGPSTTDLLSCYRGCKHLNVFLHDYSEFASHLATSRIVQSSTLCKVSHRPSYNLLSSYILLSCCLTMPCILCSLAVGVLWEWREWRVEQPFSTLLCFPAEILITKI